VATGTLLQSLWKTELLVGDGVGGDPVLCQFETVSSSLPARVPRGSLARRHLEADRTRGMFPGKGYLKLTLYADRADGDMFHCGKSDSGESYKVDTRDIKGRGTPRDTSVE